MSCDSQYNGRATSSGNRTEGHRPDSLHMPYTMYFFIGREVSSNSNVIITQTVGPIFRHNQ